MADNNNSRSEKPPNEEIIQDLTKGLQDASVSKNSQLDTSDINELCEPISDNLNGDVREGFDGLDEGGGGSLKYGVDKDDDFIDEVALKDAELSYTEEDRNRLREETLQLKQSGNELFRAEEFRRAAEKYTLALRTCPLAFPSDRAALFCNRAACKKMLGLHKSGVEDCSEAITLKPDYVKAYMRRAQMNERLEKLDEALADYQQLLKLDPGSKEAHTATVRLPGEINERNEKLKTEMFGKLKELGNVVLKPFGLSTDNFKVAQDPNSGGYSINFQQNSK